MTRVGADCCFTNLVGICTRLVCADVLAVLGRTADCGRIVIEDVLNERIVPNRGAVNGIAVFIEAALAFVSPILVGFSTFPVEQVVQHIVLGDFVTGNNMPILTAHNAVGGNILAVRSVVCTATQVNGEALAGLKT